MDTKSTVFRGHQNGVKGFGNMKTKNIGLISYQPTIGKLHRQAQVMLNFLLLLGLLRFVLFIIYH